MLRCRFWLWGVTLGVSLALGALLVLWLLGKATRSTDLPDQASFPQGKGEQSTIRDSLEFTVRDASGRIKQVGGGQ